ncbi:MAG: hypothetical protein KIT11_07855 [Fimbriimonadaceae bacterium]|nr:hypothetical protein [Fimbriimonadaceae bacterium]QYK56268.1 MAG: hypothetical protein KF733_02050 [Fimbriimonadaceae bacterium]
MGRQSKLAAMLALFAVLLYGFGPFLHGFVKDEPGGDRHTCATDCPYVLVGNVVSDEPGFPAEVPLPVAAPAPAVPDLPLALSEESVPWRPARSPPQV